MVGFADIETALRALWKNKTGASLWAIKREPVLMGLEHVLARARQEQHLDQPTADQIALACQGCISDACESWANSPDDPQIARMLLGLAKGVRGTELKVRRKRVEERSGAAEETRKHKRDGSSYETRALIVIAETLFRAEDEYADNEKYRRSYLDLDRVDFIDPYIDHGFRCVSYHCVLDLSESVTRLPMLRRDMMLKSVRDQARLFGFRDGWRVGETPTSTSYGWDYPGMPSEVARLDATGKPVTTIDLGLSFRKDAMLWFCVENTYDEKDIASENRFGFFLNPDGPPAEVAIAIRLSTYVRDRRTNEFVRGQWSVTAQVISYANGITVEKESDVSPEKEEERESFRLYEKAAIPGKGYLLCWKCLS